MIVIQTGVGSMGVVATVGGIVAIGKSSCAMTATTVIDNVIEMSPRLSSNTMSHHCLFSERALLV